MTTLQETQRSQSSLNLPYTPKTSPVGLARDLLTLLSQEIQLFKTEMAEKLTRAATAAGWLIAGGLVAYAGLVAVIAALILALSNWLSFWLAALLVGLLLVAAGVLLTLAQSRRLRQINLAPREAMSAVRTDVQLVKEKVAPASQGADARPRPPGQPARVEKPSLWQFLKETVKEWQADKASQLAAALSYYTALSIAPLLVLVVVIVGWFYGQTTAQEELMERLRSAVGDEGAQFLSIVLENAAQPTLASIAGILSALTLLWGSTNVFSQLQSSLNAIWDVEPKPGRGIWGVIKDRLLSFALVLGIAFLLLVSLLLSAALSALSGLGEGWLPGFDWLWQLINFAISFAVITVLFAAIYKVLPDVEIAWRDVWLGAAVTALLFTVGKSILAWYLANSGSTYGVVGSLVVFLLWVYYSAQILFLGAEFTQVYARHYGGGIRPAANAVHTGQAQTATAG